MASDVSVDRTVRLVVSLIFFVDVCISFVWLCPWSQEDQRKVMQCTFLRKWTGLSISELSLCRGQRGQRDMAADAGISDGSRKNTDHSVRIIKVFQHGMSGKC